MHLPKWGLREHKNSLIPTESCKNTESTEDAVF